MVNIGSRIILGFDERLFVGKFRTLRITTVVSSVVGRYLVSMNLLLGRGRDWVGDAVIPRHSAVVLHSTARV